MIIWINGSFGVGKTTVANKLKDKINQLILYASEEVGFFFIKYFTNKERRLSGL